MLDSLDPPEAYVPEELRGPARRGDDSGGTCETPGPARFETGSGEPLCWWRCFC